jgi:hypothetical protein
LPFVRTIICYLSSHFNACDYVSDSIYVVTLVLCCDCVCVSLIRCCCFFFLIMDEVKVKFFPFCCNFVCSL